MSIQSMKQALEALEKLFGIPEQFTGKGAGDVAVWRSGGSYRAQQAITSLRTAIADLEKQEPVGFYDAENKDLRQEIPMGEDGDWWQPVYTRPQLKEPT